MTDYTGPVVAGWSLCSCYQLPGRACREGIGPETERASHAEPCDPRITGAGLLEAELLRPAVLAVPHRLGKTFNGLVMVQPADRAWRAVLHGTAGGDVDTLGLEPAAAHVDHQTGPVGGRSGRLRGWWLRSAPHERITSAAVGAAHAEAVDAAVGGTWLLEPELLRVAVPRPRLGLRQASDVVLDIQCADGIWGTPLLSASVGDVDAFCRALSDVGDANHAGSAGNGGWRQHLSNQTSRWRWNRLRDEGVGSATEGAAHSKACDPAIRWARLAEPHMIHGAVLKLPHVLRETFNLFI